MNVDPPVSVHVEAGAPGGADAVAEVVRLLEAAAVVHDHAGRKGLALSHLTRAAALRPFLVGAAA